MIFFTIVIQNGPEEPLYNLFELVLPIITFGGVITIFHATYRQIVTNSSNTSMNLPLKSRF